MVDLGIPPSCGNSSNFLSLSTFMCLQTITKHGLTKENHQHGELLDRQKLTPETNTILGAISATGWTTTPVLPVLPLDGSNLDPVHLHLLDTSNVFSRTMPAASRCSFWKIQKWLIQTPWGTAVSQLSQIPYQRSLWKPLLPSIVVWGLK